MYTTLVLAQHCHRLYTTIPEDTTVTEIIFIFVAVALVAETDGRHYESPCKGSSKYEKKLKVNFGRYCAVSRGEFCSTHCNQCTICSDGSSSCSSCNIGFFGSTCQQSCPKNCVNQQCDQGTGRCLNCPNGYFGTFCNRKCVSNCWGSLCDRNTGRCSKCINGFFGESCQKECQERCERSECERDSGKCLTCFTGYYGVYCKKTCSNNCLNKSCYKPIGICTSCKSGMYGLFCELNCPFRCNASMCYRIEGTCKHGCIAKFAGNKCEICHRGKYGFDCDQNCPPNCLNGECIKHNGSCTSGCNAGYSDSKLCCANNTNCMSCLSTTICAQCANGSYGVDCGKSCPVNCVNSCNRHTGHCDSCKQNYYGLDCVFNCSDTCLATDISLSRCSSESGYCTLGCMAGFFGEMCEGTCSEYCNISCDQQSGECHGCQLDRFGLLCEYKCSTTCVSHGNDIVCDVNNGSCLHGCLNGFYGDICDRKCNVGCQDTTCNRSTGQCALGCTEGLTGPFCTADAIQATDIQATIAGIVLSVIVVMICVAAIVTAVYRKRRSTPKQQNMEQLSMERLQDEDSGNPVIYDTVPSVAGTSAADEDTFVPEVNQVDDKDEKTYYNFVSPRSKLGVKELYRFLSKSDEIYEQEFRMLPVGLIKPFKDAKLSQNARRNRYNMVYPYDDSRVKVNDEKSDYINASYIDGYQKKNAYIACLGPTKDTLGDFSLFWKMIWQEKVEMIVMVTKLKETSGMKCDQYWPNAGQAVRYGHVTVRNTGEEEYAEFVVRNMILSTDNDERQFHHIHYTAWPDKGVPSDVISIINLRNKVLRMRRKYNSPLVVHCSAGIGRTGTYIALDILIRHGLADQSVDVLGCIMNMRQQRVHMVQTVDQYKYLHHAVLWSLSIDTEPVPSDRFYDLSWVYNDDDLAKMLRQLQMENWYDTVEEKRAVKANTNLSFVNRRNADIPGRRHVVKMLPRDKNTHMKPEYINAVFIDGYRSRNRFIAAQTPLPETVPTFLDMVVQRQVRCIIDLEPNSNLEDIGEYLPGDNDELQNGNVVFKSCNKRESGAYVKRELEFLTDTQGQDKTTITHYQFTMWPRSEVVPDSVQFIKLIHEVGTLVIQTGQSGPILVHCMNGAKRCALFCAMWLLIERIGADNSVSVLNTLRQVKSRRRKAIPNKEQIEFCFKGIVTHLDQLKLNVYSNT